MSTKTLDFKSLTTKLTTEIFNFQFSIFNFIEPPGNACTKSVDCCPLSVDKYYKKLSHLAQQASGGSFFYVYRQQTTVNSSCVCTLVDKDCCLLSVDYCLKKRKLNNNHDN